MEDITYRAELCRMTHLTIKKSKDITILYFEFFIIGRGNYKYNLKFENPISNLINLICSICSTTFFDIDLEFNAKENDCYTFYAIFEHSEEYNDMVAFSPAKSDFHKLCWIVMKNDDFYSLPIRKIDQDLTNSFNNLQNLLIYQTFLRIDIDNLKEYFSSRIENFEKINKDNKFLLFIIEAFLNSSNICETVHSQMLDGNDEYIIIRDKKVKKTILSKAFDINEINGKYRLISKNIVFYTMNLK